MAERTVSEQRRSERVLALVTAGAVIGAVEAVLAVSFAALVFGGYLVEFLSNGIGLYLVAAALTLAFIAWRAGPRGIVGSIQDAATAVLAIVATSTAVGSVGSPYRSFLSVVAATLVVTFLTGVTFLVLGTFRLGNLVRFVPYPVVCGFLAGTGWLLLKGGIGVGASLAPQIASLGQLVKPFELIRWVPALVFGVGIFTLSRLVKRPFVIPAALAIGFVLFVLGMFVTGSSIEAALQGGWMLGPFPAAPLLQPWTPRAVVGADWSAVLEQAGGIATTVFVAIVAALFNFSGIELMLHTDLDSNRELRDVGVVNVVSGAFGGIPSYHALILTSLAQRLRVGAREAGLVAALVPFTAVILGPRLVELIPRMIVGGVLVFIGISFIVEWAIDVRRSLSRGEYAMVLAIFVAIVARGLLTGAVVGLVLALVLFAVNYSRIELIREVAFGSTYRSNVDRPAGERQTLASMAHLVQVLRVNGFVFFGTASGVLERIRRRVEGGVLRFLVVDLRRVTGMDSSAVLSFRKVAQLAEARRFQLLFSGATAPVEQQLRRGGVGESDGAVVFEPDLDRALQRCEDGLLAGAGEAAVAGGSRGAPNELPARLRPQLERKELPAGSVLIRQGDPPEDLFVLESGRLSVEMTTAEGTRTRLRAIRSGVVVGEVALYTGVRRTADVVAETPCVVLRLTRASIEQIEAADPDLAAELHQWLARTLAERLSDTMRAMDTLLD